MCMTEIFIMVQDGSKRIIMDKIFITLAETMKMLSLSRQTINRFIARKEIPNYKVGKRRLFDPEELVEWVKSHRDDRPKRWAKGKTIGKGKKK